jgi:catechol 2,3-dioxygenase-like lactoylglutathione lyase family enzyme
MKTMSNAAVGLAHIGLPCNDYQKSAEFYQCIGFKPFNVGENAGFFICGDCILELYQFNGSSKPSEAGPINHFALRTENIDASFADAQAMDLVIVSDGIESNDMFAPKSNRYFIFLGPDGERIEFAQVK